MSRSRAIDTRLEKLIPSLEEYIVAGVYTAAEVKQITRHRTDVEYRLVARPLLIIDVRQAIDFELAIENKIVEYCARSKVVLKHRWVVLERIEQIYKIGLKHLKNPQENEALRQQFVAFLKKFRRVSTLSQHYAEIVVKHPLHAPYWVEAALWENEVGEIDNARTTIQHAMKLLPASEDIYICALSIELEFATKLIAAIVAEQQERTEKQQSTSGGQSVKEDPLTRLESENAAMYNVVSNLALCKVVVDEALSRDDAATPSLVLRLHRTAMSYPFARDLSRYVLEASVAKRLFAAATHPPVTIHAAKQPWELKWQTNDAANVLTTLVKHDLVILSTTFGKRLCVTVPQYIRESCHLVRRRQMSKADQIVAALKAALGCATTLLYDDRHPQLRLIRSANKASLTNALQREIVHLILMREVPTQPAAKKAAAPSDDAQLPFILSDSQRKQLGEIVVRFAAPKTNPQPFRDCLGKIEEALFGQRGADEVSAWMEACFNISDSLLSAFGTSLVDVVEDTGSNTAAACMAWSAPLALQLVTVDEFAAIAAASAVHSPQSAGSGRKASRTASADCSGLSDTITWLYAALKTSPETVGAQLLSYLASIELVENGVSSVSHVERTSPLMQNAAALPLDLWRAFFVAELASPTRVSPSAKPSLSDSSSSDDEDAPTPRKRRRTEPAHAGASLFTESFGVLGIRLLGQQIFARLDASAAISRCNGLLQLTLKVAKHVVFGSVACLSWSRDVLCARLLALSSDRADLVISDMKKLLVLVEQYSPTPRQVLSAIFAPFAEAVYMYSQEPGKKVCDASGAAVTSSFLLRDATNVHEKILALYAQRVGSKHADRQPAVNFVFHESDMQLCSSETPMDVVSTSDLNTLDWCTYINFVRTVVKDLRATQKLNARAQKDCLDPRRLLAALAQQH